MQILEHFFDQKYTREVKEMHKDTIVTHLPRTYSALITHLSRTKLCLCFHWYYILCI